jgi:aryl-alcohol dehydrogenase-like predicted oxidoreductase
MRPSRRHCLAGLGALAVTGVGAGVASSDKLLPRRILGRTGLSVSAAGFGGAGIGSGSFGAVSEREALDALAAAEELGCNFIDTARIYGVSELVLGRRLKVRRDHWIVATKYSGQKAGLRATLEEQLQRLGVEAVDIYQIHWVPRAKDEALYQELEDVKREGKARFIGVSASTTEDVDEVLRRSALDTVQLPFSLLQPEPLRQALTRLRSAGRGVIARSVLREGFLTGNFSADATFDPRTDVRSAYSRDEVARRVAQVRRLDFLRDYAGSLTEAAIRYALSFEGIGTALIGTKNEAQARQNFVVGNTVPLPKAALRRVARVQAENR